MKRQLSILTLAACLAVPASALADAVSDSIARQLRDQGYGEIAVSRTLLGRTRIVARARDGYREIIVNPRTGEILRDLWRGEAVSGVEILDSDDDDTNSGSSKSGSSNSGSGSSNSGSGSSNSGSSSSNSGSGSSNSGSGSSGSSSGSSNSGSGSSNSGSGSSNSGSGSSNSGSGSGNDDDDDDD
ncbi:hypothetical protein [Albidovulum aquaemixtae]|uniref:hypothetical protein n=1 Tax=Albidovulum aquaemixtae TaxID=1542388 RepID=UPI0015E8295D|nr:hypothetical protein [Defluviimonas aquaemixtae]